MKYTAGEIKRAIVANTRPGLQRKGAMALATKIANIRKSTPNTANRNIVESKAKKIFEGMEKEGLMRKNVAGRPVREMTVKEMARAAVSTVEDHSAPSASETAKEHLAEKKEILKEGAKEAIDFASQTMDEVKGIVSLAR